MSTFTSRSEQEREQRDLMMRTARDLHQAWQALDQARDRLVHTPSIYDPYAAIKATVEAQVETEIALRGLLVQMDYSTREYILNDLAFSHLKDRILKDRQRSEAVSR